MYTIQKIAQIINAQIIGNNLQNTIEYLVIDSRNIFFPDTSAFFAIIGENNNGHKFIPEAFKANIKIFIISQLIDFKQFNNCTFLIVPNVLQALQQISTYHRNQFKIPVIGITGSNGKTIVKEWLNQLLWQNYNIVRSPKSYNSQVGVPLSVWQIQPNHSLAIFEAGISKIGEMEKLQPIINPNIGIFTNIGNAHSEGFKNTTQKTIEKLKLFKNADILIYNKKYTQIDELCNNKNTHFKTLTCGNANSNADLKILKIKKQNTFTSVDAIYKNEKLNLHIPFIDEASIENACICWLLLLYLGVDNQTIKARFKLLQTVAMRLELKAGINNCTIINDSYNADLNSLSIALNFLEQQKQHPQKTVILSEILQSGEEQETLYKKVRTLLKQKKINRVIAIGNAYLIYAKYFNDINFQCFTSTEQFIESPPIFNNETILIKGARNFAFEKIVQKLSQKLHSSILEINLNALGHNLKVYKQLLQPNTKIMAMVKAFSYGSGSFEVANMLQYNNIDYLAVAYTDEGVTLRKAGIIVPIMVLNPEPSTFATLIQYKLEPEIYSFNHLNNFLAFIKYTPYSPKIPIHIKIDTGMHRLGFEQEDINQLIKLITKNKNIYIASVFSHLAASDEGNFDDFTLQQIKKFINCCKSIQQKLKYSFIKHILNSSGITRFPNYQFDMVRLGIGLYGIDNTRTIQNKLLPISTLKTYISQIKQVPAFETIGYNRKGKLTKPSKIATVAIGYGDGLNRKLSNGVGMMYINGQKAPIIGNICMDMTMLDVTNINHVEEGDEVEIFGNNISVTEIANQIGTIPYEVLTNISGRVKRVYFEE